MRCASCGFANPEEKKFCEECGTKLVRVCPSCGAEVRPAAKFCGDCGTPLTSQSANSQSSATSLQPLAPVNIPKERSVCHGKSHIETIAFLSTNKHLGLSHLFIESSGH